MALKLGGESGYGGEEFMDDAFVNFVHHNRFSLKLGGESVYGGEEFMDDVFVNFVHHNRFSLKLGGESVYGGEEFMDDVFVNFVHHNRFSLKLEGSLGMVERRKPVIQKTNILHAWLTSFLCNLLRKILVLCGKASEICALFAHLISLALKQMYRIFLKIHLLNTPP